MTVLSLAGFIKHGSGALPLGALPWADGMPAQQVPTSADLDVLPAKSVKTALCGSAFQGLDGCTRTGWQLRTQQPAERAAQASCSSFPYPAAVADFLASPELILSKSTRRHCQVDSRVHSLAVYQWFSYVRFT